MVLLFGKYRVIHSVDFKARNMQAKNSPLPSGMRMR